MALTTNLVSYWKLDESSGNASDSVGSNTLTNNNSTAYGTGIINNGISIVAANSNSLSITNASQTGLNMAGDMSFSFWFHATTFPANSRWISKPVDTAGGYTITCINSGQVNLNWWNSAGGTNQAHFSPTLSTGTWYHMVITMSVASGATGILAYLNGVAQTVTVDVNSGGSVANTGNDFTLGAFDKTQAFTNGIMDEVGVWSRVLTSGEVTQLYNGGAGLQYPFTGNTIRHNLALLGVGS